MTDRMKGCWAFDRDIREDDVEHLVHAIKMVKGVADVELTLADSDDWMNRQQVRHNLQMKLHKVISAAFKEEGDS